MKIVRGFAIILAFLALGEALSMLIGHFIPGNVIGMILLFLALWSKLIKPEWIRSVAEFLTQNMAIFFIPAFMGIVEQWGLIRINFWGWFIILTATTILVMAAAGLTAEFLARLRK